MHTSITVLHYDAFSLVPNKGNPAGIVLEADHLTDEQMQYIAARVGFNETSFVLQSRVANFRLRYFTPGHEMNLCGHGTVATIAALAERELLGANRDETEITIETKAGILPIKVSSPDGYPVISMTQAPPEFAPFSGSFEGLASAMGLEAGEIDGDLPTVYGSTGTWTLLVPIKKLESFARMVPGNQAFPRVLKEMPRVSVHPFCLQTHDPAAHMHARHFSSAYSGTVEDPVTGTASGVMGAYYVKHIKHVDEVRLTVEQGNELGRDGRVVVDVRRTENGLNVVIHGSAVFVKQFDV